MCLPVFVPHLKYLLPGLGYTPTAPPEAGMMQKAVPAVMEALLIFFPFTQQYQAPSLSFVSKRPTNCAFYVLIPVKRRFPLAWVPLRCCHCALHPDRGFVASF